MAVGRRQAGGELSSLDRGLRILTFIQDRGQVDVAEVIEELGVPSSSAYRYVRLLKNAGFLAEVDGQLLPSQRMADRSVGGSQHLVDVARPLLSWVRERTGLNVALAVRVHTAALCLDTRRSGAGSVAFAPGEVLALYAGASATPLLAIAPAPVQTQIVRGRLHRFTAATPDSAGLRGELARIRRQGYHVTRGWLTPGMTAVGVPVIVAGACLCALSLVAPDRDLAEVSEPLRLLRSAADELSARLPPALSSAWTLPDTDMPATGQEQADES